MAIAKTKATEVEMTEVEKVEPAEMVELENVEAPASETGEPVSIPKPPGKFSLDKFKSKRAIAMANVETLQMAMPIHNISGAKDFVRLHPDEAQFWSDELCFVNVPIKGQKRDTVHLIDEELALRYLPSSKVIRCRLALATKPYDVFFLCQIPSRNLDNSYNASNLAGCKAAKEKWTEVTSRREENVEGYKVTPARDQDAFPTPKWPAQSLDELIEGTFAGRMIEQDDDPALLRLIGARQAQQ
jgi:hypothetical protein